MDWFLYDRNLHHERLKVGLILNQDFEIHETEYLIAVDTAGSTKIHMILKLETAIRRCPIKKRVLKSFAKIHRKTTESGSLL